MAVDGLVVWQLRTECFQLGFLLIPCDRDAALTPQRDALLQGGVVEGATAPQDSLKLALLVGGRAQLLLVGFAHIRYHLHVSHLYRYIRSACCKSGQTLGELRQTATHKTLRLPADCPRSTPALLTR